MVVVFIELSLDLLFKALNLALKRVHFQHLQTGGLRMANGKVKKSPFGGIPLEYNLPNKRGTVTLARWDKPDTGDSEFFVMSHIVFPSLVNSKVNLNDNTNLDRSGSSGWALGFAVWGLVLALFSITGNAFQVVEGMDVCNRIAALPTQVSGGLKMLTQPVTFNKISLVN